MGSKNFYGQWFNGFISALDWSDFLFKKSEPKIFDSGYNPNNLPPSVFDAHAIQQDWEAVGYDLKSAINSYVSQKQ